MEFFSVETKVKGSHVYVYPDFKVKNFRDFMIRGKSFYAVWDEKTGLWSRNENDVARIVDDEMREYSNDLLKTGVVNEVLWMSSYKSSTWTSYQSWVKSMFDVCRPLDTKVTFLNQEVKSKDYASRRLPYDLESGEPEAYNELMSTLYSEKERRKLEWAIGSILNGDGAHIQKFVVLYGEAGSGKSTFLHIVEQLFDGYWTTFDAKSLSSRNNGFAMHFIKDNPLVAIQHDGDLSKIEDNTLLNSIISHEDVVVNEKFKAQYRAKALCFLFLGTNTPVKISDSKSGLIRRLIDVVPSGKLVEGNRYSILMDRIPFELGKIAKRCLNVYRGCGKRYYDFYRPMNMMYATDAFYNFVDDNFTFFAENEPVSLANAYALYKTYCTDTNASYMLQRYRFREELKDYFESYDSKSMEFKGFRIDRFAPSVESEVESTPISLVLDQTESIFDREYGDCLAQYANSEKVPFDKWENVTRTLKEIDTTKLHYVKFSKEQSNHIVIDFDLKDEKGEVKSVEANLKAASKWPPTYAEFSQGGAGIHLHYIYDGDVSKLSRIYADGIEIKVFTGKSSLRRKLTKCNNFPIAHISTGLPLKEDKMINQSRVQDEKMLRALIMKNLRKEIHPYTKPSIDFIYKLLEDAYNSGMAYDVRDLRQKVLTFASRSTNQAEACLKLVNQMHFCSEDEKFDNTDVSYSDDRLVFFDAEVFSNLFLINWKYHGAPDCVHMINPKPKAVEELFKFKLVGFNNRRYDNHILYARYLGYSNEELYNLSRKIIVDHNSGAMFKEAYNISYTDVYDFAAKKQSLKKWEVELGIHHQELGLPWDQPVPEDQWLYVSGYCDTDVRSTEAVFDHCAGDWKARQILAKLSGLTVNDTTNQHTTKIIFGNERKPKLVYTDLSTGKQYF